MHQMNQVATVKREKKKDEEMQKAPLTEHLSELRTRIIISLIAIGIGFGISFYYSEFIFKILTSPIHSTIKISFTNPYITFVPSSTPKLNLVFLAPAEAIWMHIKISFISGFILASPVVFYETWKFISPGLLEHEKKYAVPFVLVTTFLFLIGAIFCFFIILSSVFL